MSAPTTTRIATMLVADLADTMAAKRSDRPVRRSLSVPADLRTACPQSEIRAADARHNERVEKAFRDAIFAAWTVFEQGGYDRATFTGRLADLKAERNRKLV